MFFTKNAFHKVAISMKQTVFFCTNDLLRDSTVVMISDFISDPKIFNIGSYSEKYTIGYLYADVSTDKCICINMM